MFQDEKENEERVESECPFLNFFLLFFQPYFSSFSIVYPATRNSANEASRNSLRLHLPHASLTGTSRLKLRKLRKIGSFALTIAIILGGPGGLSQQPAGSRGSGVPTPLQVLPPTKDTSKAEPAVSLYAP